jgi:hypothetical protein
VLNRSYISTVIRRIRVRFLLGIALVAGCGTSYRAARLTQSVSMSPMADAILSVEAGGVYVSDDLINAGMNEESVLAVELGITNAGPQPYALNAAAISCWMELSPEQPGETRSLTPAAGGEGPFPTDLASQDYTLGSTTIPAGQTRKAWVMFRGYRYPGSDVPRKITVSFPDPRGRRVQVVIADPARGQLRWEVTPNPGTLVYGVHNTSLFGPELDGIGAGAQFGGIKRWGPILLSLGVMSQTFVEQHGSLVSPTSAFSGTGWFGYVTYPVAGWGSWQDPRQFGFYAGGQLQVLMAIQSRESAAMMPQVDFHGAAAAEGGIEFDIGTLRPYSSPFPISFSGWAAPRWAVRAGYVHWWTGGGDSNGYATSLLLAW